MKILKIILAVIVALLAVLFLFLQFAVPPIAVNYVEKHSEEWIGRKVTIKDFHWNLPSLEIHVNGFTLLEQDKKENFVSWENFSIDISPLALLTGTAKVESVKLNGLKAQVIQNGDKFNFSDILEFLAKNQTDSIPQDSVQNTNQDSIKTFENPLKNLPIKVIAENINVSNVALNYNDIQNKRSITVQEISVSIPEINSKKPETKVLIEAKFPEGGEFNLNTDFNLDSGSFSVKTELEKFDLKNALSIAQSILNIDSINGNVSFGIQANGTVDSPLATLISGNLSVKDVNLKESAGGSYKLNSMGLGFSDISLEKNQIPLDSFIIKGVNAHFDILPKTTNVALLLKQSKESTAEIPKDTVSKDSSKTTQEKNASPELPNISLKKLDISDVKFTLNDYSIKKLMHYSVHDIQVSAKDVNMNSLNLDVSMKFPQSGTFNLSFKGSPKDLTTMNVYLKISKMALQPFSPYSIHYTGFPLKAGTLDVESKTNIVSNNLNSKNSVLIHKIDVEDKVKNIDPEYTIPMKVGLYLLKDRKDDIKIDLPVQGNIKDPEFSFGKIIWKTFCNLIVKVALTPTKLLTAPVDALVGDSSEEEPKTVETKSSNENP